MSVDHRRAAAFAPGELLQYLRAGFDLDQQVSPYYESSAAAERPRSGRQSCVLAGDLTRGFRRRVARCPRPGGRRRYGRPLRAIRRGRSWALAIARFDQLSRPAPRLENTASRIDERFAAHFAARDWDAVAELTADGICIDDRRHVVNAGLRRGRDAEIANLRARAETGVETISSAVIAVRGERLALTRTRFWDTTSGPKISTPWRSAWSRLTLTSAS